MADTPQEIQEELRQWLHQEFDLTERESLLILDDLLLNLEGMASDWITKREGDCPPEWRPTRIASAMATLAGNVQCEPLRTIAAQLVAAADADDQGDQALSALMELLVALRETMPPVHRQTQAGDE